MFTGDYGGGWLECAKDGFGTMDVADEEDLRKIVFLAEKCEHYREEE
jgi:hypothetical protein